jgi:hypothetical protein
MLDKMEKYQTFYVQGIDELEYAVELIKKASPVDLQFFHLKVSVEKLLKSLLSFYGIETDLEHIDEIIELLEGKTTIKLPNKEILNELSFIPYESGCASQIIYEKLPSDFVEDVKLLDKFIKEEIGEYNLKE